MPTALETIELFLKYETIDAHAHGDALDVSKAEVAALQELIKRAKAELELAQELAIDQGFATRKEIWTEEHVVRGHFKRRFTWSKI